MSTYSVRSGDTLSGIAQRYNTTADALAKTNHISNPNRIQVGQQLTVPGKSDSFQSQSAGSYTVKAGDTLSGIAGRFGTTVGALAQANHISDPNRIQVGQKLTIPGAAPAPAPAPAPSSGGSSYTVKAGDTLSGIAGRFGTTVGALAQANHISDPNHIQVGQHLIIPGGSGAAPAPAPAPAPTPAPSSGGTYTVHAGDTLSGIAARFGTSVSELVELNHISNPNVIQVGQQLKLPGGWGDPGPVSGPTPTPAPTGNGKGVSLQQLQSIMPQLSTAKAQQYLPYLNAAMAEAHIDTPKRQSAFLAQLAEESGQLRWMEELASGQEYEGRKDLGNIYPGDGPRYKGRGPIQLTGRNNYIAAGNALGIDLVDNPSRAADPDVGFRTAAWFWTTHGLNSLADAGDFREITHRINGGYNGESVREAYYRTALNVLGG